jgi:5-carboxymethyl-2-hydroxymuconate isomerase
MPHIRVELSANVARPGRLKPFLAELARKLGEFESVEPRAVKAYLNVREHFAMNPEGPAGFAHLEVSLLRGRPLELRQQISEVMRQLVTQEFEEKVAQGEIAVTIEIREMDSDTYLR